MKKELPKFLYHLTDADSYEKIKTEGIVPMIGRNSSLINESDKLTYLTEAKDAGYWRAMLLRKVILRIDTSYINKNSIFAKQYMLYKEYRYEEVIPPEAISLIDDDSIDLTLQDNQASKLAMTYLMSINDACKAFAFYMSCSNTDYGKDMLKETIKIINHVKDVFDNYIKPSDLPIDMITQKIKVDEKEKQLWKILNDEDYATPETIWLYNWIVDTFDIETEFDYWGSEAFAL